MSESRSTITPRPAADPDPEGEVSAKKIDLSATQVLGSALAAMTAAALGSRLGLAGTVIGAAMASVVAAVGSSLYTASLRVSRDRVRTVLVRPSRSAAAADRRSPEKTARRTRAMVRTAALGTLAAFVVAAVAVTGFELATGRTLSGDDGTTVGQVSRDVGGGPGTTPGDDRSAEPSATPTRTPSATPSEDPSATATTSADPSPSASAPTPSSEPTTPAPSTDATSSAEATSSSDASGSDGQASGTQ